MHYVVRLRWQRYGGLHLVPSSASSLPLDFCADDCDSDEVWARGLTCFQRSGYTAVPGWMGKDFALPPSLRDLSIMSRIDISEQEALKRRVS